jgi:transposase
MAVVKLKAKEVMQLEEVLRTAVDPRPLQRAQALVWLDEGDSVEEVADRLHVTPQSVYNWIARFVARADREMAERVADGPRSGRPRTALEIIDPLIDAVIDTDPRELGYRSTVWTIPLLQHHLVEVWQREVSTKSVGRALVRLRIRWKRPRHHLALRGPYWRQAKGGSNRGCGGRSVRSC